VSEPEKHWLTTPRAIRRLWIGYIVVLVLTVLPDLFVTQYEHFGIDGSFGFYAWYGFLACAAMVVTAKFLGKLLKRPDDYYER
jgi:hypothetical protein